MSTPDLVTLRPQGLYCAAGDFYIDPWRPVHRAVVTHGHADHARAGHSALLCAARGLPVGGELEHTDIGTIAQALSERRPA